MTETTTRYVHKECEGVTIWDLSGGFCTKCHAEGLEMGDVERQELPDAVEKVAALLGMDRPAPALGEATRVLCPGCLHDRVLELTLERAEAAEAKLAAIADHCRLRMNAPGRSGMTMAAAGLILGLAEGGSEEEASDA
jgi:hypothetical protein